MRKRLVIGLVILNILLAGAIVFGPVSAQMLPLSSLRDCCKNSVCCDNCCWFVENCQGDANCDEI